MSEIITVIKNGKTVYEGPEQRSGGDVKGFTIRYELLGIIGLMVVQIIGAVSWASAIATDVRYMRRDILALTETLDASNRGFYPKTDAVKDITRIESTLDKHEIRIISLEQARWKEKAQ